MYCLCMLLSFACCDILHRRVGDNSAHTARVSINNMKGDFTMFPISLLCSIITTSLSSIIKTSPMIEMETLPNMLME